MGKDLKLENGEVKRGKEEFWNRYAFTVLAERYEHATCQLSSDKTTVPTEEQWCWWEQESNQ